MTLNLETTVQLLLAISTIIGGAIAAYATYRSTNSSVSSEKIRTQIDLARADKEIKGFGVEEAERISNISLANAQFMQQQFMECMNDRQELEDEVNKLTLENTHYQVKLMRVVNKLRSLTEQHRKLNEEAKVDCSGFPIIQSYIEQLAAELEEEVMNKQ